ncbi:protein adenylyltransferase SelO [Desulfonatronospira sp.]|uniref:protein adenylyltransferase SelO n=1 Tax=Desulfonatronospira sp. TaxID=1962951 RepID=UPI0025B892C5|nr:YdiU family protein [Desulfonatronospira sp.]
MFRFDNTYARLPEAFYARVAAARVPSPRLIKWNSELADELSRERLQYTEEELADYFSGNRELQGSDPIALAYAGHQFGSFVPSLGDGRALLLGEVVNSREQRFDLQLKGSGRTPFSRGGDGKAPLGPVLREYLVSEAMHHLGLPTSRSLAAVLTGEPVYRDRALPGAVLTRVASSHIRIGTFEYFASRQDHENLKTLLDYTIQRHYPEIRGEPDAPVLFLGKVGRLQAELVSGWMALGFIHGVMNTDNMSVAGETIDYGPCAFMDEFSHDRVYSFIDQGGRYAYSSQMPIVLWNLSRLAECLLPLMPQDSKEAVPILENELASTQEFLERRAHEKMCSKLGIFDSPGPQDKKLVKDWLSYLERENLDFTQSFRNLAELVSLSNYPGWFSPGNELKEFCDRWRRRVMQQGLDPEEIKNRMNEHNPVFIPRNHKIEQVIEAGNQGDFSLFHEMSELLKNPYQEQEGFNSYTLPPRPEEMVANTFCGT